MSGLEEVEIRKKKVMMGTICISFSRGDGGEATRRNELGFCQSARRPAEVRTHRLDIGSRKSRDLVSVQAVDFGDGAFPSRKAGRAESQLLKMPDQERCRMPWGRHESREMISRSPGFARAAVAL